MYLELSFDRNKLEYNNNFNENLLTFSNSLPSLRWYQFLIAIFRLLHIFSAG